MKRLYFARTTNKALFEQIRQPDQNVERPPDLENRKLYTDEELLLRNEIKKHRTIRISNIDNLKLFMNTNKNKELNALVQKGKERLNREMNVMSLVKRLRHVEIMLENSLMHKKSRKMNVAHTY